MKTLLITLLLLPLSSHALEKSMEALVRSEDHMPVIEEVTLEDLVSETSFDGEHFKIVKGKDSEAVAFTADRALTLRAATTYYHLTRARNYWINHVKSDYVAKIPKMVIRIEHSNQFSELGHFTNDAFEPQYNNALTIPAGKGLESKGVRPWGMEIWFRPSKHINISELKVNDLQGREFLGLMKSFRDEMRMQTMQKFFESVVVAFQENSASYAVSPSSVIRTAGASLVMEAGYLFMDPLTKLFSRKTYWLDTAMIPEIIYHEYSHAALSDYLVLSHSTAIIEGMADFFAGQIADSPKLAKNIKEYNVYNGKSANRKQDYMLEFEMTDYANTDFVFGLLWSMKKIVGEEKGESFIFELRKHIDTNSSIRQGLVDGLIQTCDETCISPFNDKMNILKALNKRKI